MKIKYLGTAAAEGVPAPFCECQVCENARQKGGRNIRTRSQALIDDCMLIDLPADTYMHTLRENIKLCSLTACLITHPHCDHLCPNELIFRSPVAAHMKQEKPFCIYGVDSTLEAIRQKGEFTAELEREGCLHMNRIEPFVPFEVGAYWITALKADHWTQQPVFYLIEKDGQAMLYAHDTGFFPEETIEYLKAVDVRLGLVSYDCTNVLLEWDNRHHMGLKGNEIMRDRLMEIGVIDSRTIHVLNHFSHNGGAGYDELAPLAQEKGFTVSCDGLEIVL